MLPFFKFPPRSATLLTTQAFRRATHNVSMISDSRWKIVTYDLQQRGRSPMTMIQQIEELDTAKRQSYDERGDMWRKRLKVEIAALSKQFGRRKLSQKQYAMLLEEFGELSRRFEERQRQCWKKLIEETAQNQHLLVESSLLCRLIGFLII